MASDDNRFLMLCHHPNHLQSILEVYRGQCSQFPWFHNLVSVTMTKRTFVSLYAAWDISKYPRLKYNVHLIIVWYICRICSTHALDKLDLQPMVKLSLLYLSYVKDKDYLALHNEYCHRAKLILDTFKPDMIIELRRPWPSIHSLLHEYLLL